MGEPQSSFMAMIQTWGEQLMHAWALAVVGLVVGIGQLLHSKEPLTLRIVVGRAMTSGGLGMAAGAALAWAPGIPFVAQMGIAAALSSLGTSGLERLFNRFIGGGQ